MEKIRSFAPLIILVLISLGILSVILLLEGSSNKPKVVTDESGNEYTLGVEGSSSSTTLGVGESAPSFVLNSYDGKVVKLEELYKEKPVIIQFWATWCHICEQEFPENNKFAQENKDKFHFVAVNWAESTRQVESYIQRKELDPSAIQFLMNESSDVVRAYGVRGTPTHVVIDKSGKIVFYNVGYTTTGEFAAAIESI